ncbi:hypothetical protein D5272_14280 [bacterium D16-76]|nr:hypothetical protein [bacterium D16-76]
MNLQDVFASTQVVTKHPILAEKLETRCQYYSYLQRLIKISKWQHRKYPRAQLSFYKNVLCGEGKFQRAAMDLSTIQAYTYLLPVDTAVILAYNKAALRAEMCSALIDQLVLDFELSDEAIKVMRLEFAAVLGDSRAWDALLKIHTPILHKAYLLLVRNNISFIQMRPYNILITATMSAGKSTLINAFTGKNISLAQNMAATSKIHTIVSKPFDDGFSTEYDSKITFNASKDELLTDNDHNRTAKILVSTYFSGLMGGQRLVFFDSPGVNSSDNVEHTEITMKMLKAKKYKLLLYVINATQLGTTDEEQHLRFIARSVGRRKVLFVMNKIDRLISEEEPLFDIIARQRAFLTHLGFHDPILCPISARAAYIAKKSCDGPVNRVEQRELDSYIDKFSQNSLSEYYETTLGCPRITMNHSDTDNLYRDCGLAYLEKMIIQYKPANKKSSSSTQKS